MVWIFQCAIDFSPAHPRSEQQVAGQKALLRRLGWWWSKLGYPWTDVSCLVFECIWPYLILLNMFIEASWSIHVLGMIRLNMFEPFNFSQSHQRNLRICGNNDNMFGCLSRGIGWVTVEVIQKSSKIHSAGECSPSDSFAISNSRFIPQSYDRSQPWRSQGPEGLWKDWKARFSKMSRERESFFCRSVHV